MEMGTASHGIDLQCEDNQTIDIGLPRCIVKVGSCQVIFSNHD